MRNIFFSIVLLAGFFSTTVVSAANLTTAQCSSQGGACQTQCNGPSASVPGGQEFLGWCAVTPPMAAQGCCKNRTAPVAPTACPTACIDINSNCPSGTSRDTAKACSSSTLKCCVAPASDSGPGGSTPGGSGTGSLGGGSAVNITLTNPLKYDTVEGVLTSIMSGLKTIVVTLALLMIVIGGIMYILSLGNPDNMKKAKNIILAALIGLAIVLAAPAFLKEIYELLGGGPGAEQLSGSLSLTEIAKNVLGFLLSIIGILALIMLVISGIMYLTSFGNDARLKQAKAIFTASLIGIAVAMGSLVLVSAVARFFVA